MGRKIKSNKRIGVLLTLPPALKHAIVMDVRWRDSNLNDVCIAEIAAYYGIKFEPSTRRGYPGTDSNRVLLRMSDQLKRRIQRDALAHRSNMTDTLVRLLARRFGVVINLNEPTRSSPFGGGRREAALTGLLTSQVGPDRLATSRPSSTRATGVPKVANSWLTRAFLASRWRNQSKKVAERQNRLVTYHASGVCLA